MQVENCLACGKGLDGRMDKKFCDVYCKSSYQYNQSKLKEPKFYNKVDNQLKLNRKILKHFNKAGKSVVRSSVIEEKGFDDNFFTHFWKNQKGEIYFFVYEYGYLKLRESGREKYVLIVWQDYMERKLILTKLQ